MPDDLNNPLEAGVSHGGNSREVLDTESMLGQEVEYEEHAAPRRRHRIVKGTVIREYPATLLNVDTGKWIPAVRFVIRCANGREVTTDAMAEARGGR